MTNVLLTDVSFYEDDPSTPAHIDFVKMKQTGIAGTIIKAGQRNFIDSSFVQSWGDAKQAGLPRGSYWFLDSRSSPESQAQLYANALGQDTGELPLFVDFEAIKNVPNTTDDQLKAFIERLKILIPNKEIMIYTAYYYWKDNISSSMHNYFSQYGLWIANYGTISPIVPAPWNTWAFWQFSENGAGSIYGTEGKVDLNFFNGDDEAFKQRFGLTDEPPIPPDNTDKITTTHKGVTLHQITRFGARCLVHVIDPTIARIQISDCGFKKPSQAQAIYNCQIITNGGGWPNQQDANHRSNEMWVSNGKFMQQPAYIKDNRPYINVNQAGLIYVSLSAQVIPGLYNAVGFDRLVLIEGEFNNKISDRTTKDARTGSGVTADGKYILLSAEGDDRYQRGLSFPEMTKIFQEFGATYAGNNDGGSSTNVLNTALAPGPLFVGSDGSEAPVINHIMVFAEPTGDIPPSEPPIGDEMIKIRPIKADTRLRTDHNTFATVIASYGPNDILEGEFTWTAPADGPEVKKGDQWLSVTTVNGQPKNGWMAITHKGEAVSTIISGQPDPIPPTPTPAKPIAVSAEITDAGSLIVQVTDPNNLPTKVFVRGSEWVPKQ